MIQYTRQQSDASSTEVTKNRLLAHLWHLLSAIPCSNQHYTFSHSCAKRADEEDAKALQSTSHTTSMAVFFVQWLDAWAYELRFASLDTLALSVSKKRWSLHTDVNFQGKDLSILFDQAKHQP